MITESLFKILYFIVGFFVNLLPNGEDSEFLSDALSFFTPTLSKLNSIFPVDTLIYCISIFLTVEAGILTFKIMNWLFNKVRGSG